MRDYKYVYFLAPGIFYTTVVLVFLYKLGKLNTYLLENEYDAEGEALNLLQYNDYQPLKYFGWTSLWIVIGAFFIIAYIWRMKNYNTDFGEVIASFVCIGAIGSLIVKLIVEINNPILQAVFAVGLVVAVGGYAFSDS